jgi:hypothetical protein
MNQISGRIYRSIHWLIYAQVDGFVLVRDLANPTGADPPVPPPEYCVVSIAAD